VVREEKDRRREGEKKRERREQGIWSGSCDYEGVFWLGGSDKNERVMGNGK